MMISLPLARKVNAGECHSNAFGQSIYQNFMLNAKQT